MQNAGQAKVTLLLELKNRMKAGMGQANKWLNDNVKGMKEKIGSLKQKHIEAFSAMRNELPMLDRAFSVLGNPYAKIIAGVTALILTYGKASAMAHEWDRGMAKANVTAGLGKKELGELSSTILDIGAKQSGDLMKVPEAFNRLISAGLDTNTALATLEPTLQAAKAGFADVETVAMAAVSVMNSSGVKDATKVYDILFATLNKGNAEFSDIAQYLPKIIPLAKQAGISLEEVAGAYAYLTAQGMSAEASATSLQNVFKALSDQQIIFGTNTKKGLKGLGIEVFDAAGKMRPMFDIITKLQGKMQNLTNEQKVSFLDQIGFDMEAGTAIASMTQDATKLKEILEFTANSGGQLAEAVKNSRDEMESWDIMNNQVKKTFVEIGQEVNHSFGKLGDELLPMVQRGLVIAKDLFIGIWQIVTKVGGVLWEIVKPIGEAVLGIAEWIKQTGLLQAAFEFVKDVVDVIKKTVELIVDGLKWVADRFKSPETQMKESIIQQVKEKYPDNYAEVLRKMGIATDNNVAYMQMQNKLNPSGAIIKYGGEKEDLSDPNYGLMPTGGISGNKTTGDGLKPTKAPSSGTSVSGKAQQVRNVTINIGNLSNVEHMNVVDEKGKKMTKADFESWMKEMLTRTLRGVETSYQ
jgi:TP901 family phage tail tape measure protein